MDKSDLDGDAQLSLEEYIPFFVHTIIGDGFLVCGKAGKMFDNTPAVSFWKEMGVDGEPGDWDDETAHSVAAKVFDMYDVDKSGEIDKHEFIFMVTEIVRFIRVFSSPLRVYTFAEKVMKEMDSDQSGTISRREFIPLFVEKV